MLAPWEHLAFRRPVLVSFPTMEDPVVVKETVPLIFTTVPESGADLIPPIAFARQGSSRPQIADNVDLVALTAGERGPYRARFVEVLNPRNLGWGLVEPTDTQRQYSRRVKG